ncbi:MAG: mechanosensitive ion channel family protein [Phycisphaerales bacterium]|nr:mechanosensitive ion channel family protein [Phycisphaerales bacterium]
MQINSLFKPSADKPPAPTSPPDAAANGNGTESVGLNIYDNLGQTSARGMLERWQDGLENIFGGWGASSAVADWGAWAVFLVSLLAICMFANWLAKLIIKIIFYQTLRKSGSSWGLALIQNKVLTRLSHLVPVVILAIGLPLIVSESVRGWILPVLDIYTLWIILIVGYGIIDCIGTIYTNHKGDERTPIKGVLQASKLLLTLGIGLFVLSVLFSKSPVYFISGLGAFMAIILLIFRDSLLGLVAGLQLTANDMVRVGDWIEIPGKGVDGDVIEVTLTTVRVSNWDRTIAMVPAYDLFQNAFINWRGMSESGGRRIKRSINIDISTIDFATDEMLDSWKKIHLLAPYLERKAEEITAWNNKHDVDNPEDVNGRRQTNIGAFRAYVEAYLRNHSKIHQENFTFLVRQLQPGPEGLPLEVYVFTNDNRWEPYEAIQADIFDHLLAIISRFDLEVHENPSGSDIRNATNPALASAGS